MNNMTNGEMLDKELERIATGEHPGAKTKHSKELAAWLLEDSLNRFASFLFIAEVMFTRFPGMFHQISAEVLKNWISSGKVSVFPSDDEGDENETQH